MHGNVNLILKNKLLKIFSTKLKIDSLENMKLNSQGTLSFYYLEYAYEDVNFKSIITYQKTKTHT